MQTFFDWLSYSDILHRLWLLETYYSFDPAQYNQLFADDLKKLSASSPKHRDALERSGRQRRPRVSWPLRHQAGRRTGKADQALLPRCRFVDVNFPCRRVDVHAFNFTGSGGRAKCKRDVFAVRQFHGNGLPSAKLAL